MHLDPAFLRVALRAKTVERTILVTDAAAPAGAAPGRYRLGEQDVELTADDRVVLAGTEKLAGSALRMNRAIANLIGIGGLSLRDAVQTATMNPARLIRTRGPDWRDSSRASAAMWWFSGMTHDDRRFEAVYLDGVTSGISHNRNVDFDYTPEQIQLRREVREFAAAEIAPHVMEWDENQIFPLEVIKKLGQLGYMGAIFPEEYGGAGLGYVEYSIIIEELSRVDGSVGIIVAAHTSLCSNHIYKAGTEEQKQKYLTKLASGEWIGCWSLTEPEAGSDAAGTRTTAVRDGDCWVLNGSKTFTTNAHYADVCVGMAVTDRAAAQHGISAFILEKGHARLSRRARRKTSSACAPAPPAK